MSFLRLVPQSWKSFRVAKWVLVSFHRNFQFIKSKRYSNPDSILKLEKPPVPGNMCGFWQSRRPGWGCFFYIEILVAYTTTSPGGSSSSLGGKYLRKCTSGRKSSAEFVVKSAWWKKRCFTALPVSFQPIFFLLPDGNLVHIHAPARPFLSHSQSLTCSTEMREMEAAFLAEVSTFLGELLGALLIACAKHIVNTVSTKKQTSKTTSGELWQMKRATPWHIKDYRAPTLVKFFISCEMSVWGLLKLLCI